jgi:hypothetical protein
MVLRLFAMSILVLSLCVFARGALADCVSDCQASTYCGGDSYECSQLQAACYRSQCSGKDDYTAPARADGSYGAVAYDENSGAYGLSDPSPDKSSAKSSAMAFCGQNGPNCKIVETFSNECAAIAQDNEGSIAAWATEPNETKAMQHAVEVCNKMNGKSLCHVGLSHCYGG